MKTEDFCYMYRGKVMERLTPQNADILSPYERRSDRRERALLLLHGFSSSPAVYRRMIPALTMYDAVICPLLPGHGQSIDAFSQVHATDWVAHVERICGNLIDEYQQVDVLGLSLGGLLACHLSAHFPLHHLFLLAPALSLHLPLNLTINATKILYTLGIRRIRNRAGNLISSQYPELAYSQMPLFAIIQILSLIQNFSWHAPHCPTDVFLGRHDEVVDSLAVAKRFEGLSNVNIHWLAHSAHVLPLEEDVTEILKWIQLRNDSK